ncbi:MAG: pilus assembly protein PilM [Candidatus Gastranaerophilaceae bacterium]|jgi:Tfp pilus assembly PilM family ATPase
MFSKILNSKIENIIGLEILPDSLNICYAQKKQGKIIFQDYFFTNFEEKIIKNGNFADENKILNLLNHFVQKNNLKNSKINISISSNDAYVKKITLPDLPEREMALIVLQEIEKNLPISPDELYIDYSTIRRYTDKIDGNKKVDIIYAAVQKYLVQNYINLTEKAGLKINSIQISSFSALKTAIQNDFIPKYENNMIAVFIDYENTDIMFLKDGQPLEISSLQIGRKEVALASIPDTFSYNEALYSSICLEISALIDLFYSQNKNEPIIEKILLLSNSANFQDIENYISEKTSIDCVSLLPCLNFENREIAPEDFNTLPPADKANLQIGFAAAALLFENDNEKISLNVLKNLSQNVQKYSREIFSEDEKKKIKILCAASSVLICICAVVWGYLFIMNARTLSEYKKLEQRYALLKPALEKITAQSAGLNEQKEILKIKLLAKNTIDKNVIFWSNILSDISSIVPNDIKIKEIAKDNAHSEELNIINIKGQIASTKETPLKLISFVVININSNLPDSTKLTNASVKDVKFKEDDNSYEFNITSDIKPK